MNLPKENGAGAAAPQPARDLTDVEDLISVLGGFSRYQILIFACSCYAAFSAASAVVNIQYSSRDLNYRCFVPQCDVTNHTSYQEAFLNFTTPYDEKRNRWERCRYYAPVNEGATADSMIYYSNDSHDAISNADFCVTSAFSANKTRNCSEVVFDTSVFASTTVTEFGLTCQYSWLQPYAGSTFFAGMLLGGFVMGDVADRIGRRPALLIAVVTAIAGGVGSALSVNYSMFLATRVVSGFGNVAVFLIVFIMAVEFVPPSYRRICGITINIPFSLGEASVAIFAYFIRQWRWLHGATTIPFVILLFVLFLFSDESIRWLISKNKRKEAEKLVKKCARINRVELTAEMLLFLEKQSIPATHQPEDTQNEELSDMARQTDNSSKGERSLLQLFKMPNTRKRTLNMIVNWMVVTMAYYGLSANAANLGGDVFLNFAAIMLIEIPSYIFAYIALDPMGRKGTMVFTLLLSMIGCLCGSAFISDKEKETVVVISSMVGKFGASAAFAIVYIYTAELFSTEYRTVGVGVCSTAARIGGIMAPFVAGLGQTFQPLPLIIFGVLSAISAVLAVFLPETAGLDLPQTIQDGEALGRDQSVFHFTCFHRKKK